ncbi:sensor histidine kinase [Streptomyces coelicoflavus]|uniref:histidine kinase n=1 Tax=Streptomyces coelicoflavus TaxID=285562 RepID=A0A7K3PSU7_9ACTN|nr:sensor histidine kinase [Streptomyces coelicoflavus]NEB13042.1 sensor histidine kinase [Streptomyces coelicoflavus]
MKPKRQRHLHALDLGAALALTAVYTGFARLTADDGQPVYTGPFWLGCLIAAMVGLPVAVRRRWPLPVLVAVLAALATASLLDIPREPYAAAGLAAYLVGLAEPARRSVPALAVTLPVACGAVYLGEAVVTPAEDWQGAVGVAGLVLLVIGGAWGMGFTVRGRRAEAAREQRRRSERALDEERLRIARELHDIVSHNLSLIAVKAGVAGHVAEADPREARAALKVIEETSRSALADMRRTLGVLRTQGAPLGPTPDLDRLDLLAEEARRARVDVDLTVRAVEGLAEGTQLTIYRIVQEALTNVVRHAAPTRCRVTVEVEGREVRIDITDEGKPSAPRPAAHGLPGGHGLVGMRERAMMYGGSFEAGPRPEGGFAVSVRLPAEGNQ